MPANSLYFSLEIDGEKQLGATLRGRMDRLSDLTPVFEAIVRDWQESRVEIFAGEGAHDGLPAWEPLSAKYAAWKERHYPGRFILTRTGALQQAVVFPETDLQPQRLELTMPVGYGVYHQAKERGKAQFPRRQFASLGAAQKSRWASAFRRHIAGQAPIP